MNIMLAKLKKALAIALVALQVPMLMLWKITIDFIRAGSGEPKVTTDPSGSLIYELVFQWENFFGVLLSVLPILLALAACLVLSVLGLIFVLRQKHVTVPTVCFYAVIVLSCGFLCFAFAHPAIIVGSTIAHRLTLYEFMFYRYFGGMELNIIDIFPFLQTIKYVLLCSVMVLSGVLCGLGIAEVMAQRKNSPGIVELPTEELAE